MGFAAKRAGVSPKTIERYEKGKNARYDELEQIATAYGVNVETLWADYQPPVPESDGTDSLSQKHPATEGVEKDSAVYRAILEQNKSLAEEQGVTQSALENFFEILEQQPIPPKKLDAELREIATSYKQFQQRLQNEADRIDPVEKARRAGIVQWSSSRRCNFVWEDSFWTSVRRYGSEYDRNRKLG